MQQNIHIIGISSITRYTFGKLVHFNVHIIRPKELQFGWHYNCFATNNFVVNLASFKKSHLQKDSGMCGYDKRFGCENGWKMTFQMGFHVINSPQCKITFCCICFWEKNHGHWSVWLCALLCEIQQTKVRYFCSKSGCYANCFHCRHYRNVLVFFLLFGGALTPNWLLCFVFSFAKQTKNLMHVLSTRTFIKIVEIHKIKTTKLSLFASSSTNKTLWLWIK